LNRRTLLKGLAAVGVGLILPPTLEENAEAARRFWALDATMVPGWVETHGYGVVPITEWIQDIRTFHSGTHVIERGQSFGPMIYPQVFPPQEPYPDRHSIDIRY
jgi:hypothetical protein